MKFVTYNIQYGTGLDGRYDAGRIADAVRGADVIALQEVTRNNPRNGGMPGRKNTSPDTRNPTANTNRQMIVQPSTTSVLGGTVLR